MLSSSLVLVLLLIFPLVYAQENPVELIKNGDFESGLASWNARVYEYPKDQEQFDRSYFSCYYSKSDDSLCLASGWGYPLFGISDDRSPNDRYFYALVPTFYWGAKTAVSLEQEVIIPESSKVTLSFDVQGYSQPQLHIFVKQQSEDPILLNQLNVNDKRYSWGDKLHREYDLTQFSGKTIVLQFVASEYPFIDSVEEEVQNTGVYFYDVSLKAIPLPVVVVDTPNDNSSDYDFSLLWFAIPAIIISAIIIVVLKSRSSLKPSITPITHVQNSDAVLDDKYSQENFSDKPILKTGDYSFDGLYTSKQSSGLSDEDYQKLIDDSLHLKALWYISKHPNRYRNPFDLYKSFDEEFDRKSRIYDVMADDHFPKLITNLATKDKREGYILSPLGQHLLEKAKQEKIVTWDQFTKQFDEELKTGIIKQTNAAKPTTIRISSNDAEIARLFAEAKPYYGKKKDKKIISIMDKILQIDPENVIALSNKGHALSMLDQLDDAEKHFDLALKINPEYVYALANKAGLYIERNPEHAIELFQKSLKIEEDPHTYSGIATAYANLKRFEDALHYVNKALELLDVNDPYGQREHALELKHNIEDDLRKQKR